MRPGERHTGICGKPHVRPASGPVDVRTSDGRIEGTGLSGGQITAKTSNGAIDLTATKPSDVRADSSNGAISLTVPKDRYRLSAHTDSGDQNVGVPNDPSATHRLDLSTSNGDIDITGA